MSSTPLMDDSVRKTILSDPETVLEDQDIMRALVAANDQSMGQNIVDLRGIAMERLEARLDRLEETHRNVIAAAYENLAGTNQIHRAVLKLLDATRFDELLTGLKTEIGDILRVDAMVLVLETGSGEGSQLDGMGDVLHVAPKGFVDDYISRGRNTGTRPVTLRQAQPRDGTLYGEAAGDLRSEALIRLDLGEGRLPGMLAMGAEDPHQFTPQQGTDLLSFFGGVFERTMRRWLS
ncbi:DUF484 family protein [Histidinibacterium aquaticum]|uniref:DUF484 family protein n=1 Tax=Histidinibacterium aquaticum TaxID=2613962 RepID=A0A5J5GK78_9RHOB|nr:DUF484 family protein [Histidinibacterium aquaticum]KAA9008073.1 DUF484 family protein [Histidinibacterium aquaticum]